MALKHIWMKMRDLVRFMWAKSKFDFVPQGRLELFSFAECHHIVVLKLDGKLGDTQVMSHFYNALRQHNPRIYLSVVCSPNLAEIYRDILGFDQVITAPRKPRFKEIKQLCQQIQEKTPVSVVGSIANKVDLVITTEPNFRPRDFFFNHLLQPRYVAGCETRVDCVNILIYDPNAPTKKVAECFIDLMDKYDLEHDELAYTRFVTPESFAKMSRWLHMPYALLANEPMEHGFVRPELVSSLQPRRFLLAINPRASSASRSLRDESVVNLIQALQAKFGVVESKNPNSEELQARAHQSASATNPSVSAMHEGVDSSVDSLETQNQQNKLSSEPALQDKRSSQSVVEAVESEQRLTDSTQLNKESQTSAAQVVTTESNYSEQSQDKDSATPIASTTLEATNSSLNATEQTSKTSQDGSGSQESAVAQDSAEANVASVETNNTATNVSVSHAHGTEEKTLEASKQAEQAKDGAGDESNTSKLEAKSTEDLATTAPMTDSKQIVEATKSKAETKESNKVGEALGNSEERASESTITTTTESEHALDSLSEESSQNESVEVMSKTYVPDEGKIIDAQSLLAGRDLEFVVLTPPHADELKNKVKSAALNCGASVLFLPEDSTVLDLSSTIEICDALITVDTAAVHMACASEKPQLCIYTGTNINESRRWAPIGDLAQVVRFEGKTVPDIKDQVLIDLSIDFLQRYM